MRRRAVVGAEHMAAAFGLAFALAAHEGGNAAAQRCDLVGLTRDDAAEVIDDAFKVGDFLFKLFHGRYMRARRDPVKPVLAPLPPIR